jgi:hypothetical protein
MVSKYIKHFKLDSSHQRDFILINGNRSKPKIRIRVGAKIKYMKTLLAIFFLTSVTAFSQEKSYKFKIGQVLEQFDISTGSTIKPVAIKLIKEQYYFNLESIVGSNYIIRLLEFDNEIEYYSKMGVDLNKELYADNSKPIYFKVPEAIWSQFVEEVFTKWGVTFGVMNIPIKLRFANTNPDHRKRLLELDANVNLGLSLAPYWKKADDQIFFTPIGITITQVVANPVNTLDYLQTTENRSGFSAFLGLIYQKEGYQIGVLFGADWATGNVSEYWVYQGKPWLGIGIGVGLFAPNNKSVENQKK